MKPNKQKEDLIHIDILDDLLEYNEYTGIITSKVHRGPIKPNQRLGCLDNTSGYRYIMINGNRYLEHRLIWYIMNLVWPTNIIDHIDGNRSNNIYSNLRDASYRINSSNKVNNSVLGHNITKQHGNYMITLYHKGVRKSFGTYTSLERAIYIRDYIINCIDNNILIPNKDMLKEVT
ncbi:MAG: hypothetical protein BWY21_00098 [Parcubacteria group bacterium ADurb.Bin216]|nr:MAG: hypothetical protein BWY21_00098 [Parcubacteria group bacterium ADurb.Bin216]